MRYSAGQQAARGSNPRTGEVRPTFTISRNMSLPLAVVVTQCHESISFCESVWLSGTYGIRLASRPPQVRFLCKSPFSFIFLSHLSLSSSSAKAVFRGHRLVDLFSAINETFKIFIFLCGGAPRAWKFIFPAKKTQNY